MDTKSEVLCQKKWGHERSIINVEGDDYYRVQTPLLHIKEIGVVMVRAHTWDFNTSIELKMKNISWISLSI